MTAITAGTRPRTFFGQPPALGFLAFTAQAAAEDPGSRVGEHR
jgi:hypothetical protein